MRDKRMEHGLTDGIKHMPYGSLSNLTTCVGSVGMMALSVEW